MSNLPPGCSVGDLPGNTIEDMEWEQLLDDIGGTPGWAADARQRWESQPDLLAACEAMLDRFGGTASAHAPTLGRDRDAAARSAALAAIAKAKGE